MRTGNDTERPIVFTAFVKVNPNRKHMLND